MHVYDGNLWLAVVPLVGLAISLSDLSLVLVEKVSVSINRLFLRYNELIARAPVKPAPGDTFESKFKYGRNEGVINYPEGGTWATAGSSKRLTPVMKTTRMSGTVYFTGDAFDASGSERAIVDEALDQVRDISENLFYDLSRQFIANDKADANGQFGVGDLAHLTGTTGFLTISSAAGGTHFGTAEGLTSPYAWYLQPGMFLDLYDGATYTGTCEVLSVDEDLTGVTLKAHYNATGAGDITLTLGTAYDLFRADLGSNNLEPSNNRGRELVGLVYAATKNNSLFTVDRSVYTALNGNVVDAGGGPITDEMVQKIVTSINIRHRGEMKRGTMVFMNNKLFDILLRSFTTFAQFTPKSESLQWLSEVPVISGAPVIMDDMVGPERALAVDFGPDPVAIRHLSDELYYWAFRGDKKNVFRFSESDDNIKAVLVSRPATECADPSALGLIDNLSETSW